MRRTGFEDTQVGVGQQVARFRVDKKELFLSAERDRKVAVEGAARPASGFAARQRGITLDAWHRLRP